MHLRALVRQACAQPSQCIATTAPRVHQRAVAGAVLQANRIEAVVEHSHVGWARRRAQRCDVGAPPISCAGTRTGAMHRRGLGGVRLAAAHLEAAVRDRDLDEETGRLDGERQQQVHAKQSRRSDRSTRHLEVARAREDDAALHDVVGNERVQRARGGRLDNSAAVEG